ncbi:MAG TPA: hypothetical protein VHE35_10120 [Kofleriaceae bacterium]|nr:hypothetical protein [Kofleriaceae bacterium]
MRVFLDHAYRELGDAQHKARILQIAVMVGVTIAVSAVSEGFGDAAEGYVIGAVGRGATSADTKIAVQSLTMTAMMQALDGHASAGQFVEDLATNAAMAGALHGFDATFRKTAMAARIEGGAATAGYRLARIGELTGRTLTTAGAIMYDDTPTGELRARVTTADGRAEIELDEGRRSDDRGAASP